MKYRFIIRFYGYIENIGEMSMNIFSEMSVDIFSQISIE